LRPGPNAQLDIKLLLGRHSTCAKRESSSGNF
jgi:hypothetical protein